MLAFIVRTTSTETRKWEGPLKNSQRNSPRKSILAGLLSLHLDCIRMRKNDSIRTGSPPLGSMAKSQTFHLNAVDLNLLDDNVFRNSFRYLQVALLALPEKNRLTSTNLLLGEALIRLPSGSSSVQVEDCCHFRESAGPASSSLI